MHKKLKTFADVAEFLADKIAARDSLVVKFNDAVLVGHLGDLLRDDGIELIVAAHHAYEAEKCLKGVEGQPSWAEEVKFEAISTCVRNFVIERAASQFADNGRSTSLSVNLAKDAVKEFYLEFFQRLNHGY